MEGAGKLRTTHANAHRSRAAHRAHLHKPTRTHTKHSTATGAAVKFSAVESLGGLTHRREDYQDRQSIKLEKRSVESTSHMTHQRLRKSVSSIRHTSHANAHHLGHYHTKRQPRSGRVARNLRKGLIPPNKRAPWAGAQWCAPNSFEWGGPAAGLFGRFRGHLFVHVLLSELLCFLRILRVALGA